MYKHIMLPIEGDELSARAVNECLAFARSIGAKVTVLHVVPHANLHVPPGFAAEVVKDLEKYREAERLKCGQKMLADLEANARSAGVEFENLVVVGDSPYEQIIDSAEKNDCDLIMMASHARRGLDAVLQGSETARVLKHTKIPVLVVR